MNFLARLRQRDPEALRTIVNKHARCLYRAARGIGYAIEEAEDLIQDVFVTFIDSIERESPPAFETTVVQRLLA